MAMEGGGNYRARLAASDYAARRDRRAKLAGLRTPVTIPSMQSAPMTTREKIGYSLLDQLRGLNELTAENESVGLGSLIPGDPFGRAYTSVSRALENVTSADPTLYAAKFLMPSSGKNWENMSVKERQEASSLGLQFIPGIGDIEAVRYEGARFANREDRSLGGTVAGLGLTGLAIGAAFANPVGGAAPFRAVNEAVQTAPTTQPLTPTQRKAYQAELEQAAEAGDDDAITRIQDILAEDRSLRPPKSPRHSGEITFADAKQSAEAIVRNPNFANQPDVVQTVSDRRIFDALRWRVEGGSEEDFARQWDSASRSLRIADDGPVSFVLKPYGDVQKAAQVNRFWDRKANKALSKAEDALSSVGVDVNSLRKSLRTYTSSDLSSMHSSTRNTDYQVWENVEGNPIYFIKDKKTGKQVPRAKGGGQVKWNPDTKEYNIYKPTGEFIVWNPKKKGSYLVHRGDHIDHLIPKDQIGKRIEQLVKDGDVDTATKYYTFMNSPNNFFALHGATNSSKQNRVVRRVDDLTASSPMAKRNLGILQEQAVEYQAQLDNAWESLAALVGPEEADRFFSLYS